MPKPRLFTVDQVLVVAKYVRALRAVLAKPEDEEVIKYADLVAERERCLRWVYVHGERLPRQQYERVRRAMRDPELGAKQTPTRAERAAMERKEREAQYVKPKNYTKKELKALGKLTSEPGGRARVHTRTWATFQRTLGTDTL